MFYDELKKSVHHYKEDEEGVKDMCKAVEAFGEKKAEEGRINSLVESVKNLMSNLKFTAEQAMAALGVSDSDKTIIMKML